MTQEPKKPEAEAERAPGFYTDSPCDAALGPAPAAPAKEQESDDASD